jgi:hypothetical protein
MIENIWFIAAIWIGLALVASLVSIRVGVSVALIEILVGVAAGNVQLGHGVQILRSTDWTNFLAMLGLQNKIIDQKQYSILVTVVILSAFVPTLIAQKCFEPSRRTMLAWGRLYQRRVNGGAVAPPGASGT